jgi:hypothetical protein
MIHVCYHPGGFKDNALHELSNMEIEKSVDCHV